MKRVKVYLGLACLMTLLCLKPQMVWARELNPFQTKMINPHTSYRIYQNLTRKGPSRSLCLANTFKHGNVQASAVRKVRGNKYCYVWLDGHRGGWVNQRAFLRRKIAVVHQISLVKNSHYSFPTRDAINYATDAAGTVIEPSKVKVSRAEVSSSKKENYRVSYSYGKAHAQTIVQVRANAREGIVKATKKPQAGDSARSWFKHYKTSGNWGRSFAPETRPHVLKSGHFRLKTYFYQPATLCQSDSVTGTVGPVPEGLTVSNGSMYATMYHSPHDTRAHIVSYQFNHVPNRYVMQKLSWLPWSQFLRLASHVKISPYIKLGHGQAIGSTRKYIYVIANNHLLRKSSQSEEIMQISKNNLQIKQIWTFKVWNHSARTGRYFHNATFVNDHQFIAVYHDATDHRFEYWEVTRQGNSWYPKEIGATRGDFMRNDSPVQGITYDKHKKQIYLAFNDYLFKLKRSGKVLARGHFHTGREFEGISINGRHLYAELAQRPELLRQRIR